MADFSIYDQIMLNNLNLQSSVMDNMFGTTSGTSLLLNAISNQNKLAYAVEGDKKYDEEMDTNSDGTVTFSEYVKYISEQNLSKYNIPKNSTTIASLFDMNSKNSKTNILNLGKALSSYMVYSAILPQGIISREA